MILLDTTYILPFYGLNIGIHNFENDFEEILLSSQRLGISQISILEAKGKLSRILRNTKFIKNYELGFTTITKSGRFEILDFVDSEIDRTSTKIYLFGHNDLFDCIIAATALKEAEVFVTEDAPLKKIMNKLFPEFQIMNWKEFKFIF